MSSLLLNLCSFSRKVGDGWSVFGAEGGSEKERDLEGVRDGESVAEGGGRSIVVSIVLCCYRQLPEQSCFDFVCDSDMAGVCRTGRACGA